METVKTIMAYKPLNLKEAKRKINKGLENVEEVRIVKQIELSNKNYDELIKNFFEPFFNSEEGGYDGDTRLVVEITSADRESILVDPEGFEYCRYVGTRL
jgi:hypothetical protein